ncbi:ScbR family autoregulator-binding transcription factor [Homoserinimonas sp. A447]
MVRQARAEVTREALIRSAGAVFSRTTYASATLADVISEAGVTQGALYFHFESKHALALEVIRRQHETSINSGRIFLEGEVRGLEAMVLLSVELARQITTDPIVRGGLRLSTESAELFGEHASGPYTDWIAAADLFLRQAADDGDVDQSTDFPAVARFVISAFTGVQVVSQATTGWADLNERLEEMWAIVLPAIARPEKRGGLERLPALVRPDRAEQISV